MIYLVHLAEPFGHARHYCGYTPARDGWRLGCHAKGTGSNMLRHVRAAGIGWQLVRVYPLGTRDGERQVKRGGGLAGVCPLCRADTNRRRVVLEPSGGPYGARWLTSCPPGRTCAARGCTEPGAYLRPWGRGRAALCWRHAGRYCAATYGATDAELRAGTFVPQPLSNPEAA